MTGATARRELREARKKGFCGFCLVKGTPGVVMTHKRDCKAIIHAGRGRQPVRR